MLNSFCFQLCYADKGIFKPEVNPHEIFTTDIPSKINISAEIGDLPMNDVKVTIYQTDESGELLGFLCDMELDISRGLFGGQISITQYSKPVFYFKIVADYNSEETFESSILKVDIYEPLPDGIVNEMVQTLNELENNFLIFLKTHSLSEARKLTLKKALKNSNITFASLDGRNLSIIYKDRLRGIAFLDDPNGESLK